MNTLNLPDMKISAAKQFNYYVIPKMLINDPAFSELNPTAKLIYSLMLNRAALSAAHPDKFTDEHGRFFIIYTIEQLMQEMQLSKPTCVKMVQQLCDIGLIEKRRRGQGKPSFIYLKDFAAVGQNIQPPAPNNDLPQTEGAGDDFGAEPLQEKPDEYTSEIPVNFRSKESLLQEVNTGEPRDKKSTPLTPRSKDCLPQEVKNVDPRKNDKRKQDIEKIHPSFPPTSQSEEKSEEQISFVDNAEPMPIVHQEKDSPADMDELEENIRDQLEFPALAERYGDEEAREVVCLVADILSIQGGEVTIGSSKYPADLVKKRFRSLTYEHICSVMDKLYTLADVRNPHAYLKAMLFNSTTHTALGESALFSATYNKLQNRSQIDIQ